MEKINETLDEATLEARRNISKINWPAAIILVGLHLLGLCLVWLTACKLLVRTSSKRDAKLA